MRRIGRWHFLVVGAFLLTSPFTTDARAVGLARRSAIPITPRGPLLAVKQPSFILNTLPTTQYGPPWADVVTAPTNFLPCRGGPIALCYYSGPEPLSCNLRRGGGSADCECYEIPYGPYFVDIHAILNLTVYLETIAVCGYDGRLCLRPNSAPVCESINQGELIPGADMVSTFSYACTPADGLGITNCEKQLYAGCMTAPCSRTDEEGIVSCRCPTYDGPYQLGEFEEQCDLSGGQLWSAAYNPNVGGGTAPEPSGCVPDAPGGAGCPLLGPDTELPPGIDCEEVCDEYNGCENAAGIQVGYTCDATLCTATCSDQDLVAPACSGLQNCDISEITKLEVAAQCSCCASQLCGCDSNAATQQAIGELNQIQEERGIETQCQQNGTLCGN